MLPREVGEHHIHQRERDGAARALAHAAVAEIGLLRLHARGVAHPPAGTAAGHFLRHDSLLGCAPLARLRGGMSSAPTSEEIARDATWLAQALDPSAGQVRLVAMDRDSYRAASFLDDRLMQAPVNAQIVPWPEVESAMA